MKGVACSQLALLRSMLNKLLGILQVKGETFQMFH